jgi:dienelactone hydrolase
MRIPGEPSCPPPGADLDGPALAAALGPAAPGRRDAGHLRTCLGRMPVVPPGPVREGRSAVVDGVRIRCLAWDLGYGPATEAWLLTPAAGPGPWPGVVALHDHGGERWLGKEKVADGPDGVHPAVAARGGRPAYDHRPWANHLARSGFAVLVHDALSWGSRRFAPAGLRAAEGTWTDDDPPAGEADADPGRIRAYDAMANQREHTLAKWCSLLGTSFPGLLAHEDRAAATVLAARPECAPGPLACVGHSGGGARACLLAATDPRIGAVVASCAMTTGDGLLAHRTWLHSWQFLPPGWAPGADWSDILALRAGCPALVLCGAADGGFLPEAMDAAGRRLADAWAAVGAADRLAFRLGGHGHAFGAAEQDLATAWLAAVHGPRP